MKDIFELQRAQAIPYATTIEVLINKANQLAFKFADDSELAKREIIGFFISFPDNGILQSRSNTPLLGATQMNSAYLTLTANQNDFVKNAPLKMFDVASKPLLYVPIYTKGLTLRECEIKLGEVLTGTPNFAVQITFIHL